MRRITDAGRLQFGLHGRCARGFCGTGKRMTGCMAISLAGHDRKKIYIIVGEDKEYVYLADGKLRTCKNPKKKNRKHIQIIKKYSNPEVAEKLLRGENIDAGIIIQEVKACQKQM